MAELISERGRCFARIWFDDGACERKDVTSLFRVDPTKAFLEGILSIVNTTKPISQVSSLGTFNRCVGYALTSLNIKVLPRTESGWQHLLMRLFEAHFTRTDTQRHIQTAVEEWNTVVANIFERLQDSVGFVPLGVTIPRAPTRIHNVDISGAQSKVIGQRSAGKVTGTLNKLLVSVSISRTDPDYLDEVRDELSYRRKILHDCLVQWWEQIKTHFDYGQELLADVNWLELKQELDERMSRDSRSGCKPMTSGLTRESMAYQLAVIKYACNGSHSNKSISQSPYLYSYSAKLGLPPDAPKALTGITRARRVDWMLGELWAEDVQYCAALLIMLNPRWTPYAVLDARIKDPDGKPYLEIDDGIYRFRVDKPRARAKKESQLDILSEEIIETVLKATTNLRKRHMDANNRRAEYLFFTSNKRRESLSGYGGNLYKAFPILSSVLPKGTITLKRIRATEGVLEWFRTGSVQAMRKKLGNSYRVVLQHYLPAPLLAAWNVRLIRRFQNLWISVAAANEKFILDVTDFHSIDELHMFLADMLRLHLPASSPLGEELHRAYSGIGGHEDRMSQDNQSHLAVSISDNSLLALYLYQEVAIDSGVEPCRLEQRDKASGLRPRDFISLAEILRSEIPQRGESRVRAAHDSALQRLPQYRNKLKWGDLLLRVGGTR